MTIEVPQNEEISGGGKNGGGKGVVLSSVGEERTEGAYTLRNESEEKLFREMLSFVDPYIIRVGINEREEVEILEKDKPCLTKMMTAPLACVASRDRMPDREWVRSERNAENPGIRKEENELRSHSWIQIRSTR